MWLAMRLMREPVVNLNVPIVLPDKCEGIMFTFKTKKAAREFCGKKVELVKMEEQEVKK